MNDQIIDNRSNETEVSREESVRKNRGRPRKDINWPEENFTFDSLKDINVLSGSSLRKKMRVELSRGSLLKVDTLRTAFGRPKDIYKKVSEGQ